MTKAPCIALRRRFKTVAFTFLVLIVLSFNNNGVLVVHLTSETLQTDRRSQASLKQIVQDPLPCSRTQESQRKHDNWLQRLKCCLRNVHANQGREQASCIALLRALRRAIMA